MTVVVERKSEAEIPPLIVDPQALAEKEAENAVAQFDWAMDEVGRWIQHRRPTLRVSMLLDLHRKAMEGIDRYDRPLCRPVSACICGDKWKQSRTGGRV